MTTYDINQLLSDAATAGGFTDFITGHKAYHNREGRITFPACWISLLEFDVNVNGATAFDNTYYINGYVCDKCGLDARPDDIQDIIAALKPKFEKFLAYLFEHCEQIVRVVQVRQVIHLYDNNTVGYDFNIAVKIAEVHTYC